ncbi:tetraacyldisaccharide 4'-kinase [Luteimonas sp. SX5]|uniref:Tetraacyldisaccharide 4'-kinase n=1 Tax=Luteimonas galliterrae TaxID=2940486 RepID=A0ABT0MF60_9GAMM|nr:tetraacyldisaccharide 4'-kinase [Luteimonas galliterrae]MCL1633509.1 tetraacyldisaccharide 4'-kinase [Luteimonas galliterrae]
MSGSARQPPAWWYDGSTPPLHARLASGLFSVLASSRRALFRKGWRRRVRVGAPVVVIGNLTAGGTGKTPLAIALVERLAAAGRKPGVVSRGYGRADESKPVWVERDTDAAVAGDEPVLIARRCGIPVRVDRDRVAGARALVAAGCDVVVCDDGLQHYRLARDVEVEVIDGARRYGNARLLPAGPMREPPERGAECDFRVVNGGDTGFGEWPMRLHSDQVQPLLGGRARPLAGFAGQRVHAVAGIGNPERFFAMLRGHGIAVVPHAFPDHHRYVAEDFSFGSDLPVLMTEKDAVKCAAFATERYFRVPVTAELPEAFWIALLDRLHKPGR